MQVTPNNKIVFAITKSNWGGAQRYVYDLATQLKGKYEIIVVSGAQGVLTERLHEYNIRTEVIPQLERDVGFLKEIKVFFKLFKFLRQEHPHILHVNSSKIGALGALAGRLTRVPKIVFTAHGWAHKEERSFLSRNIIFILHFITVLLSHRTIAVSQEVKNQMNYLFAYKKIVIVHNGIELYKQKSRQEALNELLKHTHSVDTNTVWLGTIAELHKNKGLPYALEALSLLPDFISFIVIGDGEDQDSLIRYCEKIGINKRVHFVGHKKDAAQYLPAFDIFILPSVKEGFPYVILEAGASGLPTIATHVGGISEAIIDLKTGILVRPKRPKEIKEAVEFYIHNPDKKKEMGNALMEKVRNEFSLEKMVKKTLDVYRG